MPRPPSDKSKHNASCWSCPKTFVHGGNRKQSKNTIGTYKDTMVCNPCRKAKQESKDDRMDNFTWATLKSIDASWGYVKEGDLYALAIESFAQSLPVSVEQQQKLIAALRSSNEER